MNSSKQFKYKLLIAYDGTCYSGWQEQPNAVSIQTILQKVLSIILREEILVTGSGRTDAGVHALGQVAHFSYDCEIDLSKTLLSLNSLLPKDIRVKSIHSVPVEFHARYSASGKIYRYHFHLAPSIDPFKRLYTYHISYKFNRELLKKGAEYFLGTHDFTSFSNQAQKGSAAKNPVRTIKRLDIIENGEQLFLEFEADGFLYKMVRNITGTLIDIAKEKLALDAIPKIFAARDRRVAGVVAPARGLFLMQVFYPEKFL